MIFHLNRLEHPRWRLRLRRQSWANNLAHRRFRLALTAQKWWAEPANPSRSRPLVWLDGIFTYLGRLLSRLPRGLRLPRWRISGRLVLGSVLTLGLVIYSYPSIVTPWILPEYQYRHQRFSGTGVYDQAGTFLGLIPGHLDPIGDYSLGDKLPADHKAMPVSTVPQGWWDVLRALEDRHLGTWRSWSGIDVLALGQVLFWDIPTGNLRGASSLPMMLVRSMRHDNADPHEPLWEKIQRKWIELRDAPVLMHALRHQDMRELKRWLAMHVPLVNGTADSQLGGSLYGIEVTAQIVFGRSAHELNLGQQAMLAAAFWRPILLCPEGDVGGARVRDARWQRLKERAAWGLQQAYGQNDARTEAGLQQLAALAAPRPHRPAHLATALPTDPRSRFKVLASPVRRSLQFVHGEMMQAIAELQESYGKHWRTRVQAVHLSINAVANRRFKRALEAELADAQHRLADKLTLRLLTDGQGSPTAQVVVALADADGRLLRYYANTSDTVYTGIQAFRDRQGHYQPERETRTIASVGKVPVAVLLGSLGDDWGSWRYCNRRFAHVHNANGDSGVASCQQAGAYYRAEEVFGQSLNLPLIWRLGQQSEAQRLTLAKDFGLTLPPQAGALQVALPLGTVTAAPRTLHRMIHSVVMGLTERSMQVELPTVLSRVQIPDPDSTALQARSYGDIPPLGEVQHYLASAHARQYVKKVLSAVLQPHWGGTLSNLVDWSAGKNPYVALHIAKTGTATAGSAIRDKYAVGGLVWKGKPYSYLVLVGAGDPRKPLGRGITSNDLLVPLIRVLLQSL